ncbi:hypothetical protein HW555_014188 [Spodoptera exigua]|uniref:DDE Tnp4 domain-containing protein n=1 Tax=Spodoptera exigua TaxID=7107 RepID=A0A835G365_SPOEX|nr:hypothetical protein HW555_014188 [Spodoptera exigua]
MGYFEAPGVLSPRHLAGDWSRFVDVNALLIFDYLPSCPDEWLQIEKDFALKFPRAVGSIDGKHIVLECSINSGSEYTLTVKAELVSFH